MLEVTTGRDTVEKAYCTIWMFRGMHGGFDLLTPSESDCAPRNFVGEILAG